MVEWTIIDPARINADFQRQYHQELSPVNVPSPHPSPVELADYAARRLPAADVLRLSDHLDECTACHRTLAQLRPSAERRSGAFLVEPAGSVPSFDELAGELDGTLTPAQHAELTAELTRSPAACEALADLAAFRDELASLPSKHHGVDDPPMAQPRTGEVNKLVVFSRRRWRTVGSWATALAALFVVLALGSWMFTRHRQGPAELLRDAHGQAAVLAGLPAGLRESVETAARTGQLPPTGSTLATRREILAGQSAGAQMTAVSPVGSIVRERRPSLRWTPREGATGYLVSYAETNGGPLMTSPLLRAGETQWVLPEALQRGAIYQWQVEALHGETVIDRAPKPPAGEARFQVLDAASNGELEKVEQDDADYPLVLGVAYWRAGLANAAAAQFHRLAREHAQSVVAQRLEHTAGTDVSSPTSARPEVVR